MLPKEFVAKQNSGRIGSAVLTFKGCQLTNNKPIMHENEIPKTKFKNEKFDIFLIYSEGKNLRTLRLYIFTSINALETMNY